MPPQASRTRSGDLLSLTPDLGVRWRYAAADQAYGSALPTTWNDGAVACVASRVIGEGEQRHLDTSSSWLFLLDRDGRQRWRRTIPGGYGQPDPVALSHGVVAGFDPTLYTIDHGEARWTVDGGAHHLDSTTLRPRNDDLLLVVGDGEILGIAVADGTVRSLGRFAPAPFRGSITTPPLFDGDQIFLGTQSPGAPARLGVANVGK